MATLYQVKGQLDKEETAFGRVHQVLLKPYRLSALLCHLPGSGRYVCHDALALAHSEGHVITEVFRNPLVHIKVVQAEMLGISDWTKNRDDHLIVWKGRDLTSSFMQLLTVATIFNQAGKDGRCLARKEMSVSPRSGRWNWESQRASMRMTQVSPEILFACLSRVRGLRMPWTRALCGSAVQRGNERIVLRL